MITQKCHARLLLLLIFVISSGCSSIENSVTGDLPIADISTSSVAIMGEKMIGYIDVTIDPVTKEASLKPRDNRSVSARGDIYFNLEITDFLQYPNWYIDSSLQIGHVGLVDDSINGDPTPDLFFELFLKHPFDIYDPLLPVSGQNRADLDLFNPKVYLLNSGNTDPLAPPDAESGEVIDTLLPHPEGGTIHANIDFVQNADAWGNTADAHSINPTDGITLVELNELLNYNEPENYPGTDFHPFFRFFYGNEPDGGTNNPTPDDCRMSQGEVYDMRIVQLNITPGEGPVDFTLAVSATFGSAAVGKINRVPDKCRYFPPAFSSHTPMIVDVVIDPPDVPLMLDGSMTIYIRDMQADATGIADGYIDYSSQPDGGTLLPSRVVIYADETHREVSELTMDDYMFNATGLLSYVIFTEGGEIVSGLHTLLGGMSTGSGTGDDPFVIEEILDVDLFAPTFPGKYKFMVLASTGDSHLQEECEIKPIRLNLD